MDMNIDILRAHGVNVDIDDTWFSNLSRVTEPSLVLGTSSGRRAPKQSL